MLLYQFPLFTIMTKLGMDTFGILKGKIKKTTQQIKDELRDELYDDL